MNTKGQGLEEDTSPAREQGKNYLFTIAIDNYQFSPPLFNCVRDVERITSLLHQDYQFEPEHTFSLYNEAATEKNIFETFKQLVQLIRPEDNVLILYSGHGEYEADIEEGYWIPVDAQLGDFSDYLSNSRIVKYLRVISAHHIVLIVDACFSGSLFTHRNAGSPQSGLRLDDIPSRWLLTAGRNEVVSDGQPGDHSPFADNLIFFLENNKASSLSVVDLSKSVVDAVIYNSRQTPRGEPLPDVGHRGGQFFFHRKESVVVPTGRAGASNRTAAAAEISRPRWEKEKQSVPRIGYWLLGIMTLIAVVVGVFKLRPGSGRKFEPTTKVEVSPPVSAFEEENVGTPAPPEAMPEKEKAPNDSPKNIINRIEQAWLSAQNTDTEAAYRRFMERFPNSKQVKEAEQKIAANYRYSLLFTPVFKSNDHQLEIHFSSGKAPYQITMILPNNDKLEKTWDSNQPFYFDLTTLSKKLSGVTILKIIVTDHNYKKAGQMIPVQ